MSRYGKQVAIQMKVTVETFRTIDPLSAVLAPAKYSVSTHDKIMEIILAEGEYADK
jgi:hypothetical protein